MIFALRGLFFSCFLSVASAQTASATASIGATVIDPVSVPALLLQFPTAAVTTSTGWITIVIPSFVPPQTQLNQTLLMTKNVGDLSITNADNCTAMASRKEVIQGEFVIFVNGVCSKSSNAQITVAFN
jgi:hypothetical protein